MIENHHFITYTSKKELIMFSGKEEEEKRHVFIVDKLIIAKINVNWKKSDFMYINWIEILEWKESFHLKQFFVVDDDSTLIHPQNDNQPTSHTTRYDDDERNSKKSILFWQSSFDRMNEFYQFFLFINFHHQYRNSEEEKKRHQFWRMIMTHRWIFPQNKFQKQAEKWKL